VKSSFVFVFLDKNSRDRDYVRHIQQMLDDYMDIKYVFLDRQDQNGLYQLYRNASLIVMTPKSDGSAVTIMEAMAFGIPVILPPLEYDEDLFGDWVYKLKNWDESELAELISTAISNDNSEKLKKAKQIIREQGNREKEMEKLSQLYER
jgi:glycosyltransferase involved in cell wall biosynthesis